MPPFFRFATVGPPRLPHLHRFGQGHRRLGCLAIQGPGASEIGGARPLVWKKGKPVCPFGIHANKALSSPDIPGRIESLRWVWGGRSAKPTRPCGSPVFRAPAAFSCALYLYRMGKQGALYSRATAAATPASRPAAAWALAPEETMAVGSDVLVAEGFMVG